MNDWCSVYSGVKPYACSMCDMRFFQRYHLQRHSLTHTGMWLPSTCKQTWPSCTDCLNLSCDKIWNVQCCALWVAVELQPHNQRVKWKVVWVTLVQFSLPVVSDILQDGEGYFKNCLTFFFWKNVSGVVVGFVCLFVFEATCCVVRSCCKHTAVNIRACSLWVMQSEIQSGHAC